MPKPPTAARGRRAAVYTAPPPPPRRSLLARAAERRRPVPAKESAPKRQVSVRMVVILAAALLGLADSTYLTLTHYTTIVSLVCPKVSGSINCEAVTTSPESVVFGIPVAVLGLPFFLVMLVSALPPLWRSSNRFVAPARVASAVVGIGFVCYLLYAELYEIGKICLYCTGAHLLTLIIFIAVVTGWSETRSYAEELPEED